ncbi:Hypothetical predicted protein [Podarcis lilfordi]|uniref:Uncharacterized protein n=1 Tax=Podarcis lilfordi TaxID=74358 RepID=A0AA35KKW4_9SAUR|nr:Hypothetical predicted protein [Podarcis lilfordi]
MSCLITTAIITSSRLLLSGALGEDLSWTQPAASRLPLDRFGQAPREDPAPQSQEAW